MESIVSTDALHRKLTGVYLEEIQLCPSPVAIAVGKSLEELVRLNAITINGASGRDLCSDTAIQMAKAATDAAKYIKFDQRMNPNTLGKQSDD